MPDINEKPNPQNPAYKFKVVASTLKGPIVLGYYETAKGADRALEQWKAAAAANIKANQ